ncbi:conserved protein of unknown function [Bradyrhizobium vignae]|uniref:Protein NO VEIN C-terminal domain-containing protein n=1 Tax=Bradyrhizobium vignae TaxID=1549949 RepID=A0A2U3Q6L5_9BRAD|nr:conserved protein of unknown function [Bradyrhizobium vignae]
MGLHPILTDPVSVKPRFTSAEGPVLVPPPAFLNSDPQDRQPVLRRLLGKYDPAARDDFNRSLGRAGEEMVFKFEYDRLCQAGRRDLAKEMDWPADRGEDDKGYDIRSFEPDGEESLLEIKTTNGHARTRFWLSRQYEVAAQNPSTYRIRRVFHFENGAEMFDIKPPLDAGLLLIPDKYVAVPR